MPLLLLLLLLLIKEREGRHCWACCCWNLRRRVGGKKQRRLGLRRLGPRWHRSFWARRLHLLDGRKELRLHGWLCRLGHRLLG